MLHFPSRLVHRVEDTFGVDNLASKLYSEQWSGWKDLHSIHLLSRHRSYLAKEDVEQSKIEVFDLNNIQSYNNTFGKRSFGVCMKRRISTK